MKKEINLQAHEDKRINWEEEVINKAAELGNMTYHEVQDLACLESLLWDGWISHWTPEDTAKQILEESKA